MKSLTFTKIWLISICQGKIFGVVGSGDISFYDYFCHPVDESENQLPSPGATVSRQCQLIFLLKMKISRTSKLAEKFQKH